MGPAVPSTPAVRTRQPHSGCPRFAIRAICPSWTTRCGKSLTSSPRQELPRMSWGRPSRDCWRTQGRSFQRWHGAGAADQSIVPGPHLPAVDRLRQASGGLDSSRGERSHRAALCAVPVLYVEAGDFAKKDSWSGAANFHLEGSTVVDNIRRRRFGLKRPQVAGRFHLKRHFVFQGMGGSP